MDNWATSNVAPTAANFPAPDFDTGHVSHLDPRNRVNVWIGGITATPGAGVLHVQAPVLRSNTGSALSLAWAASGGYVGSGAIDFPAGGEQSAVVALDVIDTREQDVQLALAQAAGPANVITPQIVALKAEYIFADGFE